MADQNLGDRATLMLDPTWPHANLWRHPFGSILRFTYIDFDDGIQESSTPEWAETPIIGRGEPYRTFVGVSSREIQIKFTFHNQTGDLQNEVVLPTRFLDGLKYPVYSAQSGLSYAPPTCILKIGALLIARVVLTGGEVSWRAPIDTATLLPYHSEYSATFAVLRRFQPDLGYRFDGHWQ
jgi:hypothetical protein